MPEFATVAGRMTALAHTRLATLRGMARALLDTDCIDVLHHQPHPDLSPLLWHIGHVFFVEHYWLADQVFGDRRVTERWHGLYFPEECPKNVRAARLPGVGRMRAWTAALAGRSDAYWQQAAHRRHPLLDAGYLPAFVAQHYAQHLETMRLGLDQHALHRGATATMRLSLADRRAGRFIDIPRHRARLGTPGIEAYDNEKPAHTTTLAAFRIARTPVTHGQWLAFMADGGYQRASLWDAPGWRWREQYAITHPLHWQGDAGGWRVAVDRETDDVSVVPIHGISWYEARAYARYAGARLPDEAEWEAAARLGHLEARGRVWEWCDNAFAPYQGFTAFPYAGYSTPWFDGAHYVARGGSVHTEPEIRRPGFRNFYPPGHRHVRAGLRLAL